MKRRILMTVNPCLVESRAYSTTRALVTALSRRAEVLLLPVSGYDFARGTARAYRPLGVGKFEELGPLRPEGDLWVVYSDGYYLDHRQSGYRRRGDYFKAQLEFHRRHLDTGAVGLMLNTPEAEARTLKNWFASLDFRTRRVIPTYVFDSLDELHDLRKRERCVVAKPVWGGAAEGVRRLEDEASVKEFGRELAGAADRDLSDYCFQSFRSGDEKRLWFAGGEFVGGRRFRGVGNPWNDWVDADDFRIYRYNKNSRNGFTEDLAAARSLWSLSGLSLGSVDFIGGEINEINGAGTVMTTFYYRRLVIDVRPSFVEYLVRLAESV